MASARANPCAGLKEDRLFSARGWRAGADGKIAAIFPIQIGETEFGVGKEISDWEHQGGGRFACQAMPSLSVRGTGAKRRGNTRSRALGSEYLRAELRQSGILEGRAAKWGNGRIIFEGRAKYLSAEQNT